MSLCDDGVFGNPADITPRRFVPRAIHSTKDVDGFRLYNVGALITGNAVYPPCTPYGVMKMLEYEGIDLEGKNVVVVGASNIVGNTIASATRPVLSS